MKLKRTTKISGRTQSAVGRHYKSSAERECCKRRRMSLDGGHHVRIIGEVERHKGRRMAEIGAPYGVRGLSSSPAGGVAKAIRDALDPVRAPSKVRTLADMTEEELLALETRTGCKVCAPQAEKKR